MEIKTFQVKSNFFETKKNLSFSPQEFTYKNVSHKWQNLVGIKYGATQVKQYGIITTNTFYEIYVDDSVRGKVKIAFGSIAYQGKKKKNEIEQKYNEIIGQFWNYLTKPMVSSNLRALQEGKEITVAGCILNRKGITIKSGLIKKTPHFIDWRDARKGYGAGYLSISSAEKKNNYTTLFFNKVWNGVVLDSMLNYLWKDGKVFRLMEGKSIIT